MLIRELLSGDIWSTVLILCVSIPAVVLCLSIHEAAHGLAAHWLGDDTAKEAGRLTLAPMAHIDPFGLICLIVFGFGWARPVPVNISNFKNRRKGMALTALAGPLANFITAFLFHAVSLFIQVHISGNIGLVLYLFFQVVGSMSVGLGVFNLIPVYPLDGSRIVDAFLPFSWSQKIQKYQSVILVLFVLVLWRGWLSIPIWAVNQWILNAVYHLFSLLHMV